VGDVHPVALGIPEYSGRISAARVNRTGRRPVLPGRGESQLSGCEYVLPSSLVMRKVADSTCSAYDCEYVALAEDLKTKLVTSDKQILRDFPGLAGSLREFAGAR
jgi:hypothetical protein